MVPDVHDRARDAVCHVALLGLAERAGEFQLGVVAHRLIPEHQDGVVVDRTMELLDLILVERCGQIDAVDASAEVLVQRFHLHHPRFARLHDAIRTVGGQSARAAGMTSVR